MGFKILCQVEDFGYFFKITLYTCCDVTDGRDGAGRDGRSTKVSFNFFHTLWVKRLCIYILIYEIKVAAKILMGFKISCQVGGLGQKFQIYSRQVTFLFLNLKVHFWYPKYPSIMFIPLGYKDKVNMYLYIESKVSPIFLWVSKLDVKFQNLMPSWGSWSKISK